MLKRHERSAHSPGGHRGVQPSILFKAYAPGRIYKGKSEIFRHDSRCKILSPAGSIIPVRFFLKLPLQCFQFPVQRICEIQTVYDLPEPGPDLFQLPGEGSACCRLLIAVQKKIRHLPVFREPLSRRRHNDEPPFRTIQDDVPDPPELGGIRNRCAPEFGDDNSLFHVKVPPHLQYYVFIPTGKVLPHSFRYFCLRWILLMTFARSFPVPQDKQPAFSAQKEPVQYSSRRR